MEWKDLYPQINQPSFEAMADYIGGNAGKQWDSLFDYMNSAYSSKPKMTYSSCSGKPGWNVKFQKSGQSFGTLYPEEGSFSVFMVISYKHAEEMEILRNELSPELRVQYDNAQDYMKMGRWMMFRISTETDLRDYKLLMSVKMKPRGENINELPNCNGTNIETGVAIGKSHETGNVGPKYSIGWLAGVAQMYCDICRNCGEITRFFIKEDTNKEWIKRPGTLGSK